MAVHDAEVGGLSYETDRSRFIGRGRTLAAPRAVDEGVDLRTGARRHQRGNQREGQSYNFV